jgi:hypothetical protein
VKNELGNETQTYFAMRRNGSRASHSTISQTQTIKHFALRDAHLVHHTESGHDL